MSLGSKQLLRVVDALQQSAALQTAVAPRSSRTPGPDGTLPSQLHRIAPGSMCRVACLLMDQTTSCRQHEPCHHATRTRSRQQEH